MKDVKRLHAEACSEFHPILDLSVDGIQECKSSSLSADVYSVSFHGCRTVYPVMIIRPINKYKLNQQPYLKRVINDINDNDCLLHRAIGDNPKRSFFRCALGCGSYFGCEYCEVRAEYIVPKDKAGKKLRGHLAWPCSTANGPPRNIDNIRDIANRLREGEDLSSEECKGFWGTSHFLFLENFSFINNIPTEYMHSRCIGVVKRLIELTFNVGENRLRNTKRKLSLASEYNKLISEIKVLREFNRRIRNLDFGVMKAQEFRNIILIFFPIILKCIPDEFPKEKKMWLQLTFILRACTVPNAEFDQISNNVIESTALSFYKNYENLFGKRNCSYSIHLITCHLLQMRGDVPLTETSAFKYENFYAELRNLFQPGTISPSKQILRNCYMKRLLENHNCAKSNFYDIESKGKEDNSLIYYLDDDKEFCFFKIVEKIDNNNFICQPQGKFKYQCDLLKDLPWDRVGVFKVGPYSDEKTLIKRSEIHGKVVKVNDFFITCPNNVLEEK